MKKIDTLVEDIYEVLQGGLDEGSIEYQDGLNEFLDACRVVYQRAIGKRERNGHTLRLSNIGRPTCQTWHSAHNSPAEQLRGNTLLKFAYGDVIEALVIALSKAAGHSVEHEQAEVEVDGIKGHIDVVIDGKLVDVKSCSTYAFNNKFQDEENLGDDAFGYRGQGAGYSRGMEMPFYGWLAIDKQNGSLRVSRAKQETLPNVSALIQSARDAEASEELVRCYEPEPEGKKGNMKLGTTCSYCAYKFSCWENLRVFAYAKGPVFLTEVVEEPKVPELTQE